MTSPPLPSLSDLLERVHRRLVLFTVLFAGVALILTGFIAVRGYASRNLELIARSTAYTVEPAMVFGDPDATREGIVSVAATDAVNRVEVRGSDGALVAVWARPTESMLGAIEISFGQSLWPTPVVAPVWHNKQVIGEVRVYGGGGGMLHFLVSGAVIALCALGLTILAIRILHRRLNQDVLDPLKQIGELSHSIRVGRAFARRMPPSSIAEIDRFGQDFNALLAELEVWTSELSSENEELAHSATHDSLTGLGNRALFERDIEAAVTLSLQTQRSCAVLIIDVDRFKAINDSLGHLAGDRVLKAVAGRIARCIRHGDKAYRLGGDEFAVILGHVSHGAHVNAVSARMQSSMADEIILDGGSPARAGLSIGYAVCPQDGTQPDDLIARADAQMYAAKAAKGEKTG